MANGGVSSEYRLDARAADAPGEVRILARHEPAPGVEPVAFIEASDGCPVATSNEEVRGRIAAFVYLLCGLLCDQEGFALAPDRIKRTQHDLRPMREGVSRSPPPKGKRHAAAVCAGEDQAHGTCRAVGAGRAKP